MKRQNRNSPTRRTLGLTTSTAFIVSILSASAFGGSPTGASRTIVSPENEMKTTTNVDTTAKSGASIGTADKSATTSAAASSSRGTSASERARAEEQAPAGFILVEETVFLDMHRLPLTFISEAKADLKDKNFGAAVSSLRAASRAVNFNARQMNATEAKGHLATARMILESLANQVQDQTQMEMSDIDSKLAQALYHKGEAHRLMAKSAWTDNRYRMAGHDIRIGTESIDQAMAMSKSLSAKDSNDARKSLEALKKVGEKLVAGSGWTRDEVERAMTRFNSVTRTLAQNVLPNLRDARSTESATTAPDAVTSGATMVPESTKSGATTAPDATSSGTTTAPDEVLSAPAPHTDDEKSDSSLQEDSNEY